MANKFKLSVEQIKANIEALQAFMQKENLDFFYISSFDPYFNEYVPLEDCHRYYFSGFTGSVAEVLIPQIGKAKLYVDGRYHEQADLECDLSLLDVVKVPQNMGLIQSLKDDLQQAQKKTIGVEGDRTSLAFAEYLMEKYELRSYIKGELTSFIDFEKMPASPPVYQLTKELSGKTTAEKLKRIYTDRDNCAFYITAIDSLSWLTNCRGFHLPNTSSFLGRGLVLKDKVYVFVNQGVEVKCNDTSIEFINCTTDQILNSLEKIKSEHSFDYVNIDKKMLNASDYEVLKQAFGESSLKGYTGGLIEYHSIKDTEEVEIIKDSFKRADKAIYNTIIWVKSQVAKGEQVSELDLYNKTTEMYKEQGAVEQSFNTIAGAGANGSIIHYSDPKADVIIDEDTMCLLDSGGYFEAGFATDTTRTFMGAKKEGSAEQKKIYTLVLKGTLALQNAVFKQGTKGNGLDAICRQPLYQAGYDYAHGTGHGVGLEVHEGGAGIGPTRNYPMKAGQVISIEPGIYIPGFGGVRLENIGLVVEHPKYEGFLKFESLVYIGFDPLLIDESLLNAQEKTWLENYEAECVKRGTSFLLGL